MALFDSGLLPASFRGVPFAIIDMATQTGRRLAVHQYPGREDPWAEDMGRAARRYQIRGFILDNDLVYGGTAIELQRLALTAATEAKGAGLLVHPTLGPLTVSCESFRVGEALDGGTMSSIEFGFVEAGSQSFPSLLISSLGVVASVMASAIGVAEQASAAVGLSGSSTGASSSALAQASSQWTDQVAAAASDATALTRLAADLPGNNGRYSRGGTAGYVTSAAGTADTLQSLVVAASVERAAIGTAIETVQGTIADLTVTTTEADYATSVSELLSTLSNACADPADAIRLLDGLSGFLPSGAAASSETGQAVASLFQVEIALAIVQAVTVYQPSSYEDAFAKLVYVTGVLDGVILAAADAGQDNLFGALRALRVQVVADLKQRGASLAHVRSFTVGSPLPAVVLAQRFYRDPNRADELVGEAGDACISPLFMPTVIQALAA